MAAAFVLKIVSSSEKHLLRFLTKKQNAQNYKHIGENMFRLSYNPEIKSHSYLRLLS
jgi:hypothetical protein